MFSFLSFKSRFLNLGTIEGSGQIILCPESCSVLWPPDAHGTPGHDSQRSLVFRDCQVTTLETPLL